MSPAFCASAIMCNANVVLPDDSGPYTSIILPRGIPPTPNARSRDREPEEKVSTSSPSFPVNDISAPFPNCRSTVFIAAAMVF